MGLRIGLMFAGQGAQRPEMGKDLYDNFSPVRDLFSQADSLSRELSISRLCFHSSLADLTACASCQPSIFTVSVACLLALQSEYPFSPACCAGLSLGEYSALYASGAYDFASAFQLVAARGRFMDEACLAEPGAMAALLGVDLAIIDEICQKYSLEIANYNCPGQIIISGKKASIEAAVADLRSAGQRAMLLQVAGAYHSSLMKTAEAAFSLYLEKFPASMPECLLFQNYSAAVPASTEELQQNLINQLSGSVRWEACFEQIKQNSDVIIELGPGTVLSGLAKKMDCKQPVLNINSCESLEKTLSFLNSIS